MLLLQNASYAHPNKDILFEHLHLHLAPGNKMALIGNNGSGKSTLLKILAGERMLAAGQLKLDTTPYYIPQLIGTNNNATVAEALGIHEKLSALRAILAGDTSEENFIILNDDWLLEERCREALAQWKLGEIDLFQPLSDLSGGQKTRLLLAGATIHQAAFILMDEPSNHLDASGRQLLYDFVQSTNATLLIVSHDRQLLNLLNPMAELSKNGLSIYGGNYDFYLEQKAIEKEALVHEIHAVEKAIRKAKEKERETLERQQKLDARGRAKQDKAGVAKIMLNTLRNNAEKTGSKLSDVHASKIGNLSGELTTLRSELPDPDTMRVGWNSSALHKGKLLFQASAVNLNYGAGNLWKTPVDWQVNSGDRIAVKGDNGTGKTSLIKLVLGKIEPSAGVVKRAISKAVYIDQEYSLIDPEQTVAQQAAAANSTGLLQHEINIRLTRFLFTQNDWDKPGKALSGGERMRLLLCCLTIAEQSPDLIVLDEPTNNLDLQNIAILTNAIQQYEGTLLVISHDAFFLEQIGVHHQINLTFYQ